MNPRDRRASGKHSGSPPAHVSALFALAVRHHQAGRLFDAENVYREVLASDSEHFGSLHHLGIIALQKGQAQAAIDVIGRALAANNRVPDCHYNMAFALQALGPDAERMHALFITIDPERDTPAVIKDYLSSFDPHLVGLTGDPAAIAAVAKAYRVYSKKVPLDQGGYTMDHTAILYLMDKSGRFVSPFSLKRTTDAAAADLRRYM